MWMWISFLGKIVGTFFFFSNTIICWTIKLKSIKSMAVHKFEIVPTIKMNVINVIWLNHTENKKKKNEKEFHIVSSYWAGGRITAE